MKGHQNMEPNEAPQEWRAAEFFAGIGLAKLGMSSSGIDVVWSNDISATKHAMFQRNFETNDVHTYVVGDLGKLTRDELPQNVDVAWASFPCTDLSIAGGRAGLHRGIASSTFWHFIKALSKLGASRPTVVALENVTAFATSHSGRDIRSAIAALNGLGYSVDVLSIDARRFVPQSRPRLFLIGTDAPVSSTTESSPLRPEWLDSLFNDSTLVTHRMSVPEPPDLMSEGLASYLEPMGVDDSRWWSRDRVDAFVESLSDSQSKRFFSLRDGPSAVARTAYRRMRHGVPRWELRSDEISGCLRTSSGGSSKQAVIALGLGDVRIRWMTPREYASLMGAPTFPIDGLKEHHAYSGFGDAVCAPVVEWLSSNYIVPLLEIAAQQVDTDEVNRLATVAN